MRSWSANTPSSWPRLGSWATAWPTPPSCEQTPAPAQQLGAKNAGVDEHQPALMVAHGGSPVCPRVTGKWCLEEEAPAQFLDGFALLNVLNGHFRPHRWFCSATAPHVSFIHQGAYGQPSSDANAKFLLCRELHLQR